MAEIAAGQNGVSAVGKRAAVPEASWLRRLRPRDKAISLPFKTRVACAMSSQKRHLGAARSPRERPECSYLPAEVDNEHLRERRKARCLDGILLTSE
mmetsp:Transcript_14223/g.43665  ORF Transcript_14223/g.43665 Transcript_14223/m.43665 type:complete len:97 (+) Transcript_14223:1184-1474(+)